MVNIFNKRSGGKAQAERLGKEAMELLDGWQPNEALAKAQEALEIDPDNGDALSVCGFVYSSQKKHREALQVYQRLQRLEPESSDHWQCAGDEQRDLGQLEDAVVSYRRGLTLSPTSLVFRCKLATTLRKLGRLEEAARMLEATLALAATATEGLYNLVLTLAIFNRDDALPAILDRLEQLDPEKAREARRNLAVASLLT